MVVVGGLWELGWNTPIKEFDLWTFPLRDFGVDEFAMSPITGIDANVTEFASLEDMIAHYNIPVVVCDESAETTLEEFTHPENALYLFGKANGGSLLGHSDLSIKIPTVINRGLLWPHQAASIILYDRLLKDGNNNS